MKNKLFWSNYEKWEKKAEDEFRSSEFWNDEYENYFEITEDGRVYLGNMHYIDNVATPWTESEFYTE